MHMCLRAQSNRDDWHSFAQSERCKPISKTIQKQKQKKLVVGLFFSVTAYGNCCPSVITCKARHGQMELDFLLGNMSMCWVIACTVGGVQIVFTSLASCSWLAQRDMARMIMLVCTGAAPQSSLAQQGLARLCVLVLPLGHHFQSKSWPQWK